MKPGNIEEIIAWVTLSGKICDKYCSRYKDKLYDVIKNILPIPGMNERAVANEKIDHVQVTLTSGDVQRRPMVIVTHFHVTTLKSNI